MDVDHIFYDGSIFLGATLALTGATLQWALEVSKSRAYWFEVSRIDPKETGRQWIPEERRLWLAAAQWKTRAWAVVWGGTYFLAIGSLHPFVHKGVLASLFTVVAVLQVALARWFTNRERKSGSTLAQADHAAYYRRLEEEHKRRPGPEQGGDNSR